MLWSSHVESGSVSCGRVLLTSAALMLTLSAVPALAADQPAPPTLQALRDQVQALVDRAQIEDTINQFYKLGPAMQADFASYYTEDGVMVINGSVTRGAKDIAAFFKRATVPQGVFCIYAMNFNIVVNGNTATSENLYLTTIGDAAMTEYPKILAHGIESDQLVKLKGHWYFKHRELTNKGGMLKWPAAKSAK